MGHQVGQEVLVGNQVVQENLVGLVDRKKVPEADQAEEEAQVLAEEVQKGVGEEAQVAQVAQPAGEGHRSSLAVGSNSTRSRSCKSIIQRVSYEENFP